MAGILLLLLQPLCVAIAALLLLVAGVLLTLHALCFLHAAVHMQQQQQWAAAHISAIVHLL